MRSSMLTKLSWIILFTVISCAVYIIHNNLGLINGLEFGPGQYYYTDIPGWEKIFSAGLGTKHPVIFFTLFFFWALICWKFVNWVDKKY